MIFSFLELVLPSRDPIPIGVLLYQEASERIEVKMREDWLQLGAETDLDEDEIFLLSLTEAEIKRRTLHDGGAQTMRWLEDSLGNVLRLGELRKLEGGELDFDVTLKRLYSQVVHAPG